MSEKTTTYMQQVLNDGDDLVLVFPETLLKRLDWEEGDDLQFKPFDDGSFSITKRKMSSITLDLKEGELFKLMLMAHEQGTTLDNLIQDMLSQYLDENSDQLEFELDE